MPAKNVMSIKFKNEDLKAAMAKLSGFIGGTIVVDCTDKATKEDASKFYAQVRACNGTAQATSLCTYSGDNKPRTMIFTNQIQTVVESLSVFGKEIELEPLEGAAKVTCGTASVNVPFATDAASIKAPNTKDALILLFQKEDFQKAVLQGAYVQEEGNLPTLSKTCFIQPCISEDGKRTVKFSSTTGFLYGECECSVAIQETAGELFKQWTEKGIIVKSPALTAVARSLESDAVYVYMTEKQLMINTGSEVYNFVAVEGSFVKLGELIKLRTDKDFEVKLDKNKIKSAFKVIGLYTESGDSQMMADITVTEIEGSKVKVVVSDINGKNHVDFEAEGFGTRELRVNKPQLTRALDSSEGDVVSIHGKENGPVIFIGGSNANAFSFNSLVRKNK